MPVSTKRRAIDHTFEDVEKFLLSLVNKAVRKYKLDPDETISAAHMGFVQAFASYTEGKGRFITWCGVKARSQILDLARREAVRGRRKEAMPEDVTAPADGWRLLDWLPQLSDDARTVVMLVFEPPADVRATLAQLKADTPANWRYAIRDFVRDHGWADERTKAAFTDIKENL